MMKPLFRSFARCKMAATAVEFGMIAFPLFLVIFGIMEFGRAMWTREALQQTAIAGARCMGLVQNACGTVGVYNATMTASYIQNQAAAWAITLPATNITLNNAASCAGISGFSQVSVTYTFKTVVPVLIPSLAAGIPLSAIACFPNEGS